MLTPPESKVSLSQEMKLLGLFPDLGTEREAAVARRLNSTHLWLREESASIRQLNEPVRWGEAFNERMRQLLVGPWRIQDYEQHSNSSPPMVQASCIARWALEGPLWYARLWEQAGMPLERMEESRKKAFISLSQRCAERLLVAGNSKAQKRAADWLLTLAACREDLKLSLHKLLDSLLHHPSGLPTGYLVLGANVAVPSVLERYCKLFETFLPSKIPVPERADLYVQSWKPYLVTALNQGTISPQESNNKPVAANVLKQLASRAPLQEAYPSSPAASWALLQACWPLLTPGVQASMHPLYQQLQEHAQSVQALAGSPDMASLCAQAQNSTAPACHAPPKVRPRR